MNVAKGCIIRIDYELKVKGGAVIESSAKSGPVVYPHGQGKMIAGLEKALEGAVVGEERKGEIPAAEAFGTEDALPTTQMLVKEFPAGEKLDAGRVFEAKGPDGKPVSFKVISVAGDKVAVRLLPPLVGKDLEYRVKVLAIDAPAAKKRAAIAPPPPPSDAVLSPDEIKEEG